MHSTVLTLLNRFCRAKNYLELSAKMPLQTRRWLKKVAVHKIPLDITSASLKRTLKSVNIPFEEGPTCLSIQCTICSKLNKNLDDSRVHINKTTGAFICACNYAGQWEDVSQSFAAKNTKCKTDRDNKMLADMEMLKIYLVEVNKSTVIVNTLSLDVQNDIINMFNFKGCTTLVFDVLDVRINADHSALHFPLRNTTNKSIVGYSTIVPPNCTHITNPQLAHLPLGGVLYARANTRTVRDSSAIIVGSVRDMVALLSAKVAGTVVVAPTGLSSLSQFVLPCFESFGKVILWFGDDLAAWDGARMFARKLGERRCLVVRSINQQTLRLPHIQPDQNFRSILQSAQPVWHKSITNFAALREDVLSDLLNVDKVQGIKWQRFPTLTRILKGHRRGELTVLTGPTGSGKTTFISEYSLDLAMQDVHTLWGSFEIRNARLARTMLQQFTGVKLDEHLDRFGQFADAFEQLPIYFMTFHGQQPVKVVMDAIEHAVYVHDISHVIIDNVQFMLGLGGGGGGGGGGTGADSSSNQGAGDRFWRQDQVIAAFRTFATQRNCHVTLVIHPRKERDDERLTTASIFGGAKASQEADNVLIVQDGRLSSLRGKKYLQIAKNRYSGDLGLMPLDFNKEALSYAQKQSKEKQTEQLETSPGKKVTKPNRFSSKKTPKSNGFEDGDGYSSSDND